MNEPLVTVNILSYNRKNELRNTLLKLFQQSYKKIEVIVVDNSSSDGSPEMVESEFPSIKLIRLKKNIGIAGWNEGFKIAKGEYVLVLDDDAYTEKDAVSLAVKEIEKNSSIGIIAFNVYNILKENRVERFPGGWLPGEDTDHCSSNYFLGCAFMLRKSLYINNLFPDSYFICFHELPIVRYLKQNNYTIFYNRKIKAFHINQDYSKPSPVKEYYHFRNLLNFVLWNLHVPINFFYGMRIWLFFFTRSIRHRWFVRYLKSILYQTKNLQGYKLIKMSKEERKNFFRAGFVEYRLSQKFSNLTHDLKRDSNSIN
jgi:GT2 family glycosyltransferase